MTAAQLTGRALVAGVFVHSGWCTLRDPGSRVEAAGPLLARLRKHLPFLPGDETLVRANAMVHVGAGLLLAAGVFQRAAARLLALSLVPTTIAGHPFWEASDPARRDDELIQAVQNLGLLGALALLDPPRPAAISRR
jgi:putative oxidoreductase